MLRFSVLNLFSISSLSKQSRFFLNSSSFATTSTPSSTKKIDETSSTPTISSRAERKKLRDAQIASFASIPTEKNPASSSSPSGGPTHHHLPKIFHQKRNQKEMSFARIETQMMLAKQNYKNQRQIFLKTVEHELIQGLISNQKPEDNSDFSISDIVVILNALQFFESNRADVIVKLFQLAVDKLEAKYQQVTKTDPEMIKFLKIKDALKKQQSNNNNNNNSDSAGDDSSKLTEGIDFQHLKRMKVSLTQTCSAVSYALQYCAKAGIIKTEDLHRALTIIIQASSHKEIYDDAGCYTRCIVGLLHFSAANKNSNNNNNDESNDFVLMRELFRMLGKIPLLKFHNGSVKPRLALDFLRSLTLMFHPSSNSSNEQLHRFLKQTKSYHLIEHFCFIITDRSQNYNTMNNVSGNNSHHHHHHHHIPKVSIRRLPHPEQLQETHHLVVTKLGFYNSFRWLENQLVHESQQCHGVIANMGQDRDEQHEDHNYLYSSSQKSDDDRVGNERRRLRTAERNGAVSSMPRDYPVMNYIAAFGDENVPHPTVSGRMDHIDKIQFEDDAGESAFQKRMRVDHGFNVKTDADFE